MDLPLNMKPTIKTLKEKKLIGLHLKMSLIENKTAQLWGTSNQNN